MPQLYKELLFVFFLKTRSKVYTLLPVITLTSHSLEQPPNDFFPMTHFLKLPPIFWICLIIFQDNVYTPCLSQSYNELCQQLLSPGSNVLPGSNPSCPVPLYVACPYLHILPSQMEGGNLFNCILSPDNIF